MAHHGDRDPTFAAAASAMPATTRKLLVENVPPADVSVEQLLTALGRTTPEALAMAYEAPVMEVPQLLSAKACATLRAAVDAQRRTDRDSVDGGPEHQLNLSREALELLVGAEECARLFQLPREFRLHSALVLPPVVTGAAGEKEATDQQPLGPEQRAARVAELKAEAVALNKAGEQAAAVAKLKEAKRLQATAEAAEAVAEVAEVEEAGAAHAAVEAAEAAGAGELREMFVRRYSVDTRPWNPFHTDAYEVTVNVALSADSGHGGGALLGVYDGQVRAIPRAEGDATVHSSKLLHGVTAMSHGTRYSLIVFFDRRGKPAGRWARPAQEERTRR